MYVFPGIGLGAILCKAVNVTQGMIYASGESLCSTLTEEEKGHNLLYPDITRIREVSVVVTRFVIRAAQTDGVDRELAIRNLTDEQLDEYIKQRMYDPFKELQHVEAEVAEIHSAHAPKAEPVAPLQAAAGSHL
jgi:malate dehydrogenase (oxaloacetate-decarboxylating)(NADP+)